MIREQSLEADEELIRREVRNGSNDEGHDGFKSFILLSNENNNQRLKGGKEKVGTIENLFIRRKIDNNVKISEESENK